MVTRRAQGGVGAGPPVPGGGTGSAHASPGPYEAALERAGRLLARRPHGEAEVRSRLEAAGFEAGVIERAVARLRELRLVDDRAFAEAWVEHRAGRLRAVDVLIGELEARGIDRAVAEEVVGRAGLDDAVRARMLAARSMSKVAGHPLEQQALKLQGMLMRRGFDPETTVEAVSAVLPPEGWD